MFVCLCWGGAGVLVLAGNCVYLSVCVCGCICFYLVCIFICLCGWVGVVLSVCVSMYLLACVRMCTYACTYSPATISPQLFLHNKTFHKKDNISRKRSHPQPKSTQQQHVYTHTPSSAHISLISRNIPRFISPPSPSPLRLLFW